MRLMSENSDIFDSAAEALVNPVDCTGAQGAGLALAFRRRYPSSCMMYRELAKYEGARTGSVSVWGDGDKKIVFFPTKRHWREPSLLTHIVAGLADLGRVAILLGLKSIAIPALGCGEGGLSWGSVRPLLVTTAKVLAEEGIEVEIYPPHPPRQRRPAR